MTDNKEGVTFDIKADLHINNDEAGGVVQEKETKPKHLPIVFDKLTDLKLLQVTTQDGKPVAQVSGYGLELGFNMDYLKDQESINQVADAIAALVVQTMMDAVLNQAKIKSQNLTLQQ